MADPLPNEATIQADQGPFLWLFDDIPGQAAFICAFSLLGFDLEQKIYLRVSLQTAIVLCFDLGFVLFHIYLQFRMVEPKAK